MPRTTIIRQTWRCTGCGYESDRLVGACSTNGCTGTIYQETDPAKCGSMTVIGPEDIESEITVIQAQRAARGQPISPTEIATYRAQRTAEMVAAIASIKLREHKL